MESEGRTPLSDVIVGCVMMLLSMMCAIAYTIILKIIWKADLLKMVSYKIMFALGVFDTIQCIPHFVTGIFTIEQSVFHPILSKLMGVLATPSYIAYVTLTTVLAFNRLMLIYSPRLEATFFSKSALNIWIGSVVVIWLGYATFLSLPWATINYVPEQYSWNYNYSQDLSYWVQKSEILVEFSSIFLSTVFYAFTIGILCRTEVLFRKGDHGAVARDFLNNYQHPYEEFLSTERRKRFVSISSYRREMKVFIQAFIITTYCTILNLLWHNSTAVLPANIWSYMALNMMWILNAGINPLMYIIVNRVIREQMTVRRATIHTMQLTQRSKVLSVNINRANLSRTSM